jgi:hypothetical protein
MKLRSATDGDLRPGIPVYKMSPALVARRYFDDIALRDRLARFTERGGSRKDLPKEVEAYMKEAGALKGHFETKNEQARRIKDELLTSKQLIETKLSKKCDFICWPWGSVDSQAIRLALEAGFKGGVGMRGGANMAMTDIFDIHRFNPCGKDLPSFKQALHKYSSLFLSVYINDKIDALLIPKKRFI